MIVTELLAKFGLQTDTASFSKAEGTLQGLVSQAQRFAGVFAGAFALQKITHFTEDLIHAGSELNDTSIKLGIATDSLQQYRFAAQQVGVEQATLETSFKFLAKSAYDASTESKEAAGVYAKLGVNVKDSNGKVRSTEDLFADVADALSKTTNETEKTALAMKIFGRGGQEILPLLKDGSKGIEKLRQEAKELGGGFDEEFIKGADELGDKLDKLSFAGLSLKNKIGNALFPVLDAGVTKLLGWSKALFKVLEGTRVIEIGLMGLAAASTIAGVQALIPWLPFLFSFLAIAAAITATIAIIDEIHALLTGGRSLIGKYIDEWLGIGMADQLVRQWSEGLSILIKNVKELLEFKNPLDSFIGMFKGAFEIGDVLGKEQNRQEHIKDTEDYIAKLRKEAPGGKSPIANALDRELSLIRGERTATRGIAAPLALDKSIPRAAGRGIDSPLAAGSAGFGQASTDAVHPLLRPSAVQAHGEHGGTNVEQHNEVHVEVNAHSGASPEEIARHAEAKVTEAMHKQNRNLRKALVNRPAAEE